MLDVPGGEEEKKELRTEPSLNGDDVSTPGLFAKLRSSAVYNKAKKDEKTDDKKDEKKDDEKEKPRQKAQSRASVGSSGSRGGVLRFSREISETFSSRLYEMKWNFLSVIINALLLLWVIKLPEGMLVPLPPSSVQKVGGVIVEIILLIANVFAIKAMDHGLEAYFGHILSTRGISMAVCGFAQTPSYLKWSYSNELSLNSSVRKSLNKLSYIWLLVEFLKLLTPFPATALRSEVVKADSGNTPCIEFNQQGQPSDRQWPTFEVEAGVAELIFGNSIGELRSQMDVNITRAVTGPQLIGAVNDGDTLAGKGFVANLLTHCRCTTGNASTNFEKLGVTPSRVQDFMNKVNYVDATTDNLAIVNMLENLGDSINITAALIHSPLCGGFGVKQYPVCKTTIDEHMEAIIEVQYMTDGTPASIAQAQSHVREVTKKANIDRWLYQSLVNIYQGDLTVQYLPATVPGMLAPLMYWTSPDLIAIDMSMVEAGLETLYVIMMRGAIQRSYGHDGSTCIRNAEVEGVATMTMQSYGVTAAVVALVLQLIASFFSLFMFVPWLMSDCPSGPAIRAVKDNIYFTTLLADSNFSDHIRGLCNAPSYAIWQGLDIVVRVGESIESVEEEVGHITMDKPKLVRPMVNGRKYN